MGDTEKKQRERLQEIRQKKEMPDTWVDVLIYPAGVLTGAILAAIVEFFLW